MRIAVCDDVPVYVEQLKNYIREWAAERKFPVHLTTFKSGEEVLFDLEMQGDFVAVFMDVRLDGMSGIETAARIRELNLQVSIIFVSQYREHFDEMSRTYPYQYMEKPITGQKVYDALDTALKVQKDSYESFIFRHKRRTYNISLWKVFYFVSDRRRIRIMMEDGGELVFYEKLDDLEKRLSAYNHRFIRIHQSYLVNERQIDLFFPDKVKIRNGELLPISREKRSQVRKFCMELWE